MYIRIALLVFTLLFSGSPALAADWSDCEGTTTPNAPRIEGVLVAPARSFACWDFDNGDADTVFSTMMESDAPSMLVTLDPDTLTAGVQAAKVDVLHCGPTDTACSLNTCEPIRAQTGALDGTAGTSITQNRSVRVGPGKYCIDISVIAAADDTARVFFKGE